MNDGGLPKTAFAISHRQGENYAPSIKTHSTSRREGHLMGMAVRSPVGWAWVFCLFVVEHGPVHYGLSDHCVQYSRDRYQQTGKAQI